MTTLNIDTKSQLAKLLATENITVQQNNVKTASFDVVARILTLPIFKTDSKDVTDMLIAHECAHALFTPTKSWQDITDDDELRSYINVLEDTRIDNHGRGLPKWIEPLQWRHAGLPLSLR